MRTRWHLARSAASVGLMAGVVLTGCEKKSPPSPDSTPPAKGSAIASASATPPKPKPTPTMVLGKFDVDTKEPLTLHSIGGAILVAEPRRVGRIVGDTVEWIGKIPTGGGAMGRHLIYDVTGSWPDEVDVFYHNENGRAPEPTYYPLTGKGRMQIFGEGGYGAYIVGVTSVGESSLLISWDTIKNVRVWTARGPQLSHKLQTLKQAGCKPDKNMPAWRPPDPAVRPSALGSTHNGIVVSMGEQCDDRGIAAEVFDANGASRIVSLAKWYPPSKQYEPLEIYRGRGDELFLTHGESEPILRFSGGEFKPLPALDKPWKNVFVAQSGQLHVSDGETIMRYEDEAWKPVAKLAWPVRFDEIAIDGETIWVGSASSIWKLVEGPGVGYHDGCTTPFVYLYDVSPLNDAKFTYPATRKAMATFPEVEGLSLEEFRVGGVKRLGISVASKEQGEAVIAHVKANMKDEDPKLVCYKPSEPRRIELKAKKGSPKKGSPKKAK